jgi:tetratricopeptide (TPR) repeat protein
MTTDRAVELQESAWALQDAGALDEAVEVCTEALRFIQLSQGDDSPDYANLLNDLSELEFERQRFHCALQVAESAKLISDEWNTVRSDVTLTKIRAKTLEILGALHRTLGDYQSAEIVLLEAAEAASKFGPKSPDIAQAKNNLGMLYKYWGRFNEGLQLYREALGCFAAGSLESGQILHNIGGILHASGNPIAAEQPAREAWVISTSCLGPNSREAVLDALAYAAVLDDLDRLHEAEPIYISGLEYFKVHFGPGHYEMAAVQHNLAAHRASQGRLEEAEQYYRSALKTKIALIGRDSPDVALTEQNLGALLHQLGRSGEGAELLQHAVGILTARLLPSHPILLHAIETWQKTRPEFGGSKVDAVKLSKSR